MWLMMDLFELFDKAGASFAKIKELSHIWG
jgi:hypothetical protein